MRTTDRDYPPAVRGVWAFLFLVSVMIITAGVTAAVVWLVHHSIEPYRDPAR